MTLFSPSPPRQPRSTLSIQTFQGRHPALPADWIEAFTSPASDTWIAKAGNIPNTTRLISIHRTNPKLAASIDAGLLDALTRARSKPAT